MEIIDPEHTGLNGGLYHCHVSYCLQFGFAELLLCSKSRVVVTKRKI